jgi:rhodanese-related sulfurtransferase
MLRRAAVLLAAAVALGATAHAVHPRRISWSRPLGAGLRAEAAQAGLVVVGLPEVERLLQDGRTLFLDARPAEKFEIGELPGARSMPWKDVEEGRLERPPLPVPVPPLVVYCENEWCESSLKLGTWLKSKGCRDVALFVAGYEAWWNARP